MSDVGGEIIIETPRPNKTDAPVNSAIPTESLEISIQSANPSNSFAVVTVEPVLPSTDEEKDIGDVDISTDADPVIFSGMDFSHNQKCGHGDVVAIDGHTLRATPELVNDRSNFLEKLPEGTRVDIIDCRLWTDTLGFSWLAVRTNTGKLGWLLIQNDKFYVTVYPIAQEVPHSVTGIPAGSFVAYVPPSECKEGPVSTEATATSIGVDLIPVVGDIKGLNEVYTGCDMVTGESLGNWRWLGLLGIVGLAELSLLRYSDEAVGGVRVVDNLSGSLRYSDEVVDAALRNADSASDFLKNLDELDEAGDLGSDALRYFDEGIGLSDEAIQSFAKLEQPCSFTPETVVMTFSGLQSISSIEIGTQVLAFDEETGHSGWFDVVATSAHLDQTLLTVDIGSETILTTPEHPFYVNESWVPAIDLKPGMVIYSAAGILTSILEVTVIERPTVMYNLTVEQAHTYFVGSGLWLVHNACSTVLRRHLADPGWGEDIPWQAHHIVPGEFEKHGHPFVMKAIDGGWDIDGAGNGIALPKLDEDAARLGLPAHRGSHPNYSSLVGDRLDDLNRQAIDESWSNQRCAQELQKLADQLRQELFGMFGFRLN